MNSWREVACRGICFRFVPITLIASVRTLRFMRPHSGSRSSERPEIGPHLFLRLKATQHHAEGLDTEQLAGIHRFPQGHFRRTDDCQQERDSNAAFPVRAAHAATKPDQTVAQRRQIIAELSNNAGSSKI